MRPPAPQTLSSQERGGQHHQGAPTWKQASLVSWKLGARARPQKGAWCQAGQVPPTRPSFRMAPITPTAGAKSLRCSSHVCLAGLSLSPASPCSDVTAQQLCCSHGDSLP